jgi:FixJ family two-component response regulator
MTCPLVAVVDDDEALCLSLVDLMHSVGYRAEPYTSAEMCLASPSLFSINCIVADVHMPGMGGLNLVRRLREIGITTPVILITALPDNQLDAKAVSVGAVDLLRKPFETAAFLDRVERCLSDGRS